MELNDFKGPSLRIWGVDSISWVPYEDVGIMARGNSKKDSKVDGKEADVDMGDWTGVLVMWQILMVRIQGIC